MTEVKGFFDGLRPVERITVSEWADKYRLLSSVVSAEAWRYRIARTPYLKKIMDCLSANEPYHKIVVMKGAQVGYTELCCNFIGYCMHINPASLLMVQPTSEMVDLLSKTRIDTLIAECPELTARVSPSKSHDDKNTITVKSFPGGVLRLAGANSGAGLRSMAVKNLILDEVDAYPLDVNGEGNPVELAVAHTSTFEGNKKVLMGSTPTINGISAIEREFFGSEDENGVMQGATDRNYYHVPCPHCGEKQKLVFEQLKWDEGKPETAQYCCIHCDALIDERHKVQMFAAGEWIPQCPENANDEVIGFHINSLYSPYGWKSWKTIAREWIDAQNVQNKMKVFVNTVLGESWSERGEAPEYMNLYNRREDYQVGTVPADVCFLTAGVDVQKDRLEIEIVGWCADKRSYSIDYRVLEGNTALGDVWNKLSRIVDERFPRDGGLDMPVRMMCVDSGYNTTHVYDFCRKYGADRVVPIKGRDGLNEAVSMPKPVDIARSGKRIGSVKVRNVGSSFLKMELYSWLRLEKENGEPPPCYCHFPQYDERYFMELTAEQ
jgi:phage terminase large subunit GpA-like protein